MEMAGLADEDWAISLISREGVDPVETILVRPPASKQPDGQTSLTNTDLLTASRATPGYQI